MSEYSEREKQKAELIGRTTRAYLRESRAPGDDHWVIGTCSNLRSLDLEISPYGGATIVCQPHFESRLYAMSVCSELDKFGPRGLGIAMNRLRFALPRIHPGSLPLVFKTKILYGKHSQRFLDAAMRWIAGNEARLTDVPPGPGGYFMVLKRSKKVLVSHAANRVWLPSVRAEQENKGG